jgi:hypothetical protein
MAFCIASQADGRLCRAPATIRDPQCGELVCGRHDPERWRRFVWTAEDAEGLTLLGPDGVVLEREPEEDADG